MALPVRQYTAGSNFREPSMADLLEPPDRSSVMREARGLLELPRLLLHFPELARQPRGRGEPVLILPGYGSSDLSTGLLRRYLGLLNYRAHGWGLGRNSGDAAALLPKIITKTESLARQANQRVHLIGWSFGGYLARDLARQRGDLIGQVVTLGTPVVGGPKYTVFAKLFQSRGMDVEAVAAEIELRNKITLCTPVIAIYSRCDGIVAWQACIDEAGGNVEHVEVRTSHFGFGFCPDVYKIIAQRLARAPGAERN